MNLLYLIFGNDPVIHLQATFSVYSFLTQPKAIATVNIITDNEQFYKHLGEKVNVIQITERELTEWKGHHRFMWRIKIKAIEKVCHLYPNEPVLYLDTDTFFRGNIDAINSNLKKGIALMHENEGILSRKKNRIQKKMWQKIKNESIGDMLMKPTDCMWNAGVVATPNTLDGKDCELALTLCDQLCNRGLDNRFIEQYALSLALEKSYGLAEAKENIAHYWSNKELWNKHISRFFIQAFLAQWSYEHIVSEMMSLGKITVPIFRIKNTNERLKEIIDMAFPIKERSHLSKQ